MGDDRARILNMVASGKISVAEAEELIDAVKSKDGGEAQATAGPPPQSEQPKGKPKYLRVKVTSAGNDNVNVRVPMNLLRAGIKLKALIPPHAVDQINRKIHEQGLSFDINSIKQDDIEALVEGLADMEVNVDSRNGDNVRVFCE